MPMQVLSAQDVRAKWREVVDAAQTDRVDTVVQRYGKPVAVVIPHDDYMALQEELEDLRDARLALAELEAWKKDPSTGQNWDELRAEMVAEGLLSE